MNQSDEEKILIFLAFLLKQVGGSISLSREELHDLIASPPPVVETFYTGTGAFVIRVRE